MKMKFIVAATVMAVTILLAGSGYSKEKSSEYSFNAVFNVQKTTPKEPESSSNWLAVVVAAVLFLTAIVLNTAGREYVKFSSNLQNEIVELENEIAQTIEDSVTIDANSFLKRLEDIGDSKKNIDSIVAELSTKMGGEPDV